MLYDQCFKPLYLLLSPRFPAEVVHSHLWTWLVSDWARIASVTRADATCFEPCLLTLSSTSSGTLWALTVPCWDFQLAWSCMGLKHSGTVAVARVNNGPVTPKRGNFPVGVSQTPDGFCRRRLSDRNKDHQASGIHKLHKSSFSLVSIKVGRLESEPWHFVSDATPTAYFCIACEPRVAFPFIFFFFIF